MSAFDVERVRALFPFFNQKGAPLIYLDSAATAHKPQQVIDAESFFYAQEYATVNRALYSASYAATERCSCVRRQVKEWVGARHEEEIVFTRGATESINLVARSFGALLKPGDEILLSEMEHHANIVPWQQLAQERGVVLKWIPIDRSSATLSLVHFKKLLSRKTALVSIAHIANSTGTLHPIKKIIELSHAVEAKVLIDGAQAASHITIDVEQLGADFYAFSGHKMYGPTGVGVLYGKRELLEAMPPFMGGGDMIEEVTLEGSSYQKAPLKFEAGTPPIAQIIGLGAAIDTLHSIGRQALQERLEELTTYALRRLAALKGVRIIGSLSAKRGPIISFTLERVHPFDLATLLDLKRIAIRSGHLCAKPTLRALGVTSLSRLSFGIYNTFEEIDCALKGIQEARSRVSICSDT